MTRGARGSFSFALAAAFLSCATVISAQELTLPPPASAVEGYVLQEYWAVVRGYVDADPVKAVADLSKWPRDRITKVQTFQTTPDAQANAELGPLAEWTPRYLRAAGLLHSDLALSLWKQGDGNGFDFQIGVADRWLALADGGKFSAGSLRARWTALMARLHLNNSQAGYADRYLSGAAGLVAGDATLSLLLGVAKETQAAEQTAAWIGGKLQAPVEAAKQRDAMLSSAADAFRAALALDPSLTEARVRLAHVDILRGRDTDAEPALRGVLSGSPAPALKYLASLMLGGVLERKKDFNGAAHEYLNAILAVPSGQSAYVALAHVMHLANQREQAATVLDRWFALGVSDRSADPWWTYDVGLDVALDAAFSRLRAEVRGK